MLSKAKERLIIDIAWIYVQGASGKICLSKMLDSLDQTLVDEGLDLTEHVKLNLPPSSTESGPSITGTAGG